MATRRSAAPTLADVASEAGVSQATASRALAGSPLVNANTRQRVWDVAERLFDGADPMGRDVRIAGQRFEVVGVVEKKGRVLGQSFVISAAHTDADIDQTIEATAGALKIYTRAVEAGSTDGLLVGRPVAPAMREFAEPRRLPQTAATIREGMS